MYRTARSPQDDSESSDERGSVNRPSSRNQKTPGRPNLANLADLASASSASSSGSSSTASSVWDKDSIPVGTPITPPISDTPDSINANKIRLASHGRLSRKSFMERCVETTNISSATHASVTTRAAKRSSRTSSASEFPVERMGKLSLQDQEKRSSDEGGPPPDNSPHLARRVNGKKSGRQAVQAEDGYFNLLTKSGESNQKSKTRDFSQTNETMDQVEDGAASISASSKPKIQRTLNLGRDTSSSGKKKRTVTLSTAITRYDDEDEEMVGDSSGITPQSLPLSTGRQGLKTTQSAHRNSHKRSKSAPGAQDPTNPIAPDDSLARTTSGDSSPPQSNGVHASLLVPAHAGPKSKRRISTGYRKPRRVSTGSLDQEQSVLSSIELPRPGEDERIPGAFPIESISILGASRRSPSCQPTETTLDLKPVETRKFPKLEPYHPRNISENDVKNEILRIIRRKNAKPVAESSLNHGYVYIFKSDRFPGYVKIGSTIKAPDDRIKKWKTNCKFECVHVSDENDKAFRFCRIVEQIVHAELYNQRRKFYCDHCKSEHYLKLAKTEETGKKEMELRPTEHGEWFEISEEKAKEVVNKWRDWVIHQEPYKQDAMLRSCWVWKYEMGTKRLKGTEREWEDWRQFGWHDKILLGLYDFNKWLGEVSPPLQKLVHSSGSVFVLAAGFYLWSFGVNLASCLKVLMVLLLYRFICFKFC